MPTLPTAAGFWIACVSLVTAMPAQELVKNGDFSNGANGWTLQGSAINPTVDTFETDGVATNACFALYPGVQGVYTLSQSLTFATDTRVEISVDLANLWVSPATAYFGATVSVALDTTKLLETSFDSSMAPKLRRARLCGVFDAKQGARRLVVSCTSKSPVIFGRTPRLFLDNISVKTSSGPVICLEGDRLFGQTVGYTITTELPWTVFLSYVSPTRIPGVRIPGWNGLWQLDPAAMVAFRAGITDAQSRVTGTIRLPVLPLIQRVPLYWQGAEVSLNGFNFGNASRQGFYDGLTGNVGFIEEDFTTQAKLDNETTGAVWGGGSLTTGKLGGSGILGEFDATDGRALNAKDNQGRDIYVWDTNGVTIPATRTLDGKSKFVSNGIFEFQTFVVAANQRVVFIGDAVPEIRVIGRVRIEGAVEVAVPTPPKSNSDARRGIFGAKGGPGGAHGGQGGDSPAFPNGSIHGRAGDDVVVPAGHPRANQSAGTGGGGSLAHPKSGLTKDVVWIVDTGTKIFVPMTAAGGAGGSFWDLGNGSLLGKPGVAQHTIARRPFWPFVPNELGPPSVPGKAFPVLPEVSTVSSRIMFLIGGSGGGGAGVHALYTTDQNRYQWSPGGGGGGGGGVLHFRCGNDFVVGAAGEVFVRGGASNDNPNNNTLPPVHAAGGAGSGGSCLVQTGGRAQIAGAINSLGGEAGQMFERTLLYVSSVGGDGGAGYIRVEADPKPVHTGFAKFAPPATAANVGLLRPIDYGKVTVGQSLWYTTKTVTPSYEFYRIRAKVGGVDIVYSDDPRRFPGSKPAVEGEPVSLLIQSARVAANGKPVNVPTPWIPGDDIRVLNATRFRDNTGNGFRFYLKLDKSKTSTGDGAIVVESVQVYVRE